MLTKFPTLESFVHISLPELDDDFEQGDLLYNI